MKNENYSKGTKEIMSASRLELANPDFSGLLMNKIALERNRKIKFEFYLSFFLRLATIGVIVFLVALALNISFFNFTQKLNAVIDSAARTAENAGPWIRDRAYFILPLIVLLILKNLVGSRLKYV